MKKQQRDYFFTRIFNKKRHFPFSGQLELTYRCSLNCIHCYCKGSENKDKELTTREWKKILDQIHREGCIWLALTGGDPLNRDDFLEIYSYAKDKGFIITLFTNGHGFTEEIIVYLSKFAPFVIEITLNGITKETYESVTRAKGSFFRVMKNIKKIKERKLPLILKANCLKQNKDEIVKIKAFADKFLGRSNGRYHFKYDPMIYPRLDRNTTPCQYRLSFEELLEVTRQDPDIWGQYQQGLHSGFSELERDSSFLYRCNAWMNQFFIDPYGRLKFCHFSEKFSTDLKTTLFRESFYKIFPQVLKEKFKTNSKCQNCRFRPICYHCPARAYLETGDEEAPVPYYCQLAKETFRQLGKRHVSGNASANTPLAIR